MSYTFSWPAGPKEVFVTGTFDNWSKSLQLAQDGQGKFFLTVPFQTTDKIDYKYVVDGEWTYDASAKNETDEGGNTNNFLLAEDLVSSGGAFIPESGFSAAVLPHTDKDVSISGEPLPVELPAEVPAEAPAAVSEAEPVQENIVLVKDPETVEAFTTINNVDPKTLNEPEPELSEEELAAPGEPASSGFAAEPGLGSEAVEAAEAAPAEVSDEAKAAAKVATEAQQAAEASQSDATESIKKDERVVPTLRGGEKKKSFFGKLKKFLK